MAEAAPRASGGWRRGIDYILGRNTLIGIASLALLIISGYATWHGMRDFIIGVSATPTQPSTAPLTISTDVLVIMVVATLTFLMWLMLRETFGGWREFRNRVITFILYVFLAVWSVGFGYGFWWSLISGEEATRTGLAGLQEDARDASAVVAARLDAVRTQLDSVVSWSESQMAREETSGGSCGTPSGAGRGPLYNARRSVRDGVANLRDNMTRSWLEPVQAEVEQLRESAGRLQGETFEERQQAFEQRASEIRGSARNIAARSNALGQATASEMRALAETVSVPPGQPGFSCYDPTLAQRLTQAAEQASQPAELALRDAAFSEGPAGVANAVKNLWTNIGTYSASLVRFVFSGDPGESTTDTGQPITGRDLIALLASIGIDLGILVLAILNPPQARPEMPRDLRRQIRAAIDTAIARAPNVDIEWVRRHFIYHKTASYLVIPNLYSADAEDTDESAKALAMNQLAGVLDDMDLIEWPAQGWPQHARWQLFRSELEKLRREESLPSSTDLTEVRQKWLEEAGHTNGPDAEERDKRVRERAKMRNHGLFSKAESALKIAGWSERARRDVEVYRLVDTEGLTPILGVLNDAEGPAPDETTSEA